jgi:hypothetical protein
VNIRNLAFLLLIVFEQREAEGDTFIDFLNVGPNLFAFYNHLRSSNSREQKHEQEVEAIFSFIL